MSNLADLHHTKTATSHRLSQHDRDPVTQTQVHLQPIGIPLSLLMIEPHPVLVRLHTTHGGVPVPIAAEHFMACIELARSVERSCPSSLHSVTTSETVEPPKAQSHLSPSSTPSRHVTTSIPRRSPPLSDPPSQTKRFSSSSLKPSIPPSPSELKLRSRGHWPPTAAAAPPLPPLPKDQRVQCKISSKATACETAARFMEQVYAASKEHPITPTPQPDLMSQLIERNDKLEEEVQFLRARLTSIESSLDEYTTRITDIEGEVHGATDAITDLQIHKASVGKSLDEGRAGVDVMYRTGGQEPEEHPAQSREDFEKELNKWMARTESLNKRVSILEACEDEDDWVDDI